MIETGVIVDLLVSLGWSVECCHRAVSTDLLHHRQNPRFRVIVSVGANDQVDLLAVGILTEGLGQSEEGILGSGGDDVGREDGGGSGSHDVRGESM